jgi:two-component system chemotaxis response regulator CheY
MIEVLSVMALKKPDVNLRLTKWAHDSLREKRTTGKPMQSKDLMHMPQCLIIASDEDDRQQLARVLQSYGFELAIVESADQALALCRRRLPDLVVMPELLQGIESCEFIRELHRAQESRPPKVLVYSDRAEAGLIGRAIWSGASECFVKPFDASIIDLKLRQVGVVQGRG